MTDTTNLVERLQAVGEYNCSDGATCNNYNSDLFAEAATELTRLREALAPFSEAARKAGIVGASVTGGYQWRTAMRMACKFVTIEDFGRANVVMDAATTNGAES